MYMYKLLLNPLTLFKFLMKVNCLLKWSKVTTNDTQAAINAIHTLLM